MALPISTEGLARTSARHPWLVIGSWLAVVVASIALIATLLSGALTTEVAFTNNPESKRAGDLLEDRLRGPRQANEIVIVRSDELTVDDAEFRDRVEAVYEEISALGPEVIDGGTNFYQTGDESLVSADRRTTILPFVIAGEDVDAVDKIDPVLEVVDKADATAGPFDVMITGGASLNHDFDTIAEEDLRTGETIGIPIALIILLVVFGALTAALIPLVLGILSIIVAVGITALFGQGFEFSFFVVNVIGMMGLAVGIDYALFIVSRYREERSQGLEKVDAISAAGSTASRAVFFSGITVVLALAGMLIIPSTIFKSLAAGAIIVVLVSVLVSLTLLPALLGLLGDKVNSLRVPFIGRGLEHLDAERTGGFWDTITKAVMRYPVVALIAASAFMLALAVPLINLNTGSAGVSTLPQSARTKEGFELLEREFSFGLVNPAEVVIEGDINSPAVQGAIEDLEASLATDLAFSPPEELEVNEAGDVALLSVPIHGDPNDDPAIQAVERLRYTHIASAFAGVDAMVLVGGATAGGMDYFNMTDEYTPYVLAFVLGLSFILLTIVFRSLIVPVKAIIMNLLSVGAAYGLLVLVFQEGFLNEVFGFQKVDVIEAWVPLWTFCILFGLSMDYHVFLLSRIRERFDLTRDNSESVAFGLRSTATIITGAALIMAAVFGGIAMGDLVMFQQMGFGLGVAVILDATIVRSVLVPSAMQLLGDRNWYLPRFLNWLPDLREREGRESAETGLTARQAAGGAEASSS
jgi:RND superfamily putative drug exporter